MESRSQEAEGAVFDFGFWGFAEASRSSRVLPLAEIPDLRGAVWDLGPQDFAQAQPPDGCSLSGVRDPVSGLRMPARLASARVSAQYGACLLTSA
jgi:hypothetical protein